MMTKQEKEMVEKVIKMLQAKYPEATTIELGMDESGYDITTSQNIYESCGCCSYNETKIVEYGEI